MKERRTVRREEGLKSQLHLKVSESLSSYKKPSFKNQTTAKI